MKIIFLFFSITLLGCSDLIDERHFEVDERLIPFVNNFYKEAKKQNVKIQHDYLIALIDNDQAGDVLGESEKNSSIPKIHINSQFFKTNDYDYTYDSVGFYSIQYIVYHELGHALLYRGHVYDHRSIMEPGGEGFTMNEYYSWASVRVKLNKELFTQ